MDCNRRLRVLHINLSPPGKGGIERLLVDFFHHLHGDDFDIGLCILSEASETSERLSKAGCSIWHLHRRTDRFDWGLYSRLSRLLQSERPDVVHIHGNPSLIYGVPAARWSGIRNLVYTCHFSQSGHGRLKHRFLASLLRWVRRPIAVSEAARQVLVEKYGVPFRRIEVVYNGVDLGRFSPKEPGRTDAELVIGFCGVFRPEKQLPMLVEATARLRKRGLPARLLLVGNGPTSPAIAAQARELGIAEFVGLPGEQEDVRPFLQQMDVFALPSQQEAMPVALLEAMASARPVVASAVGGIREIVRNEVSGLLIHPESLDQLTDSLQRLATDTALRQRIGQAARQVVIERFSSEQMMRRYAGIYREVAARGSPRPVPALVGTAG